MADAVCFSHCHDNRLRYQCGFSVSGCEYCQPHTINNPFVYTHIHTYVQSYGHICAHGDTYDNTYVHYGSDGNAYRNSNSNTYSDSNGNTHRAPHGDTYP